MRVYELIEKLKKLPQNMQVKLADETPDKCFKYNILRVEIIKKKYNNKKEVVIFSDVIRI